MSTLKGITPKHLHLVINVTIAYLSVLQAGLTLEDLGLEELAASVKAEYALFRVSDEDVDIAGRTLRAVIQRLGLRTISREEALIILAGELAEMRKALQALPLSIDSD